MIQHDFPTSTHIARIKYDADTAVLTVEFRSGTTYHYEDVEYEVVNKFIEAPSAGKYFNSEIKSKYRVK